MIIKQDDLTSEATRALLALHLQGMFENSPPDNVFALDLSGLQQPGITVWSAWDSDRIMGIGALKQHDGGQGEIKSMRTDPRYLRRGVAAAILDTIITAACHAGLTRLSLETGRGPAFEPALAMYARRGFAFGGPFADYKQSDFSQFMHMDLAGPAA